MSATATTEEAAISALVARFFAAFSNRTGPADVRRIHDLCLPSAVIVKSGPAPEAWSLRDFAASRQALLSSGSLLDFEEHEIAQRTDVAGNVAQRRSIYRKTGVLAGQRFETLGAKLFQCVRTPAGWRLSAVAWDDEREGFAVADLLQR